MLGPTQLVRKTPPAADTRPPQTSAAQPEPVCAGQQQQGGEQRLGPRWWRPGRASPAPWPPPGAPLTSSLYPRAPSLHAGACLASVLATSAVSPGAARRGSCGQCGARCAVRPGIQRTPVAVWPSRRKHGRGLRRDLNTGIVILRGHPDTV